MASAFPPSTAGRRLIPRSSPGRSPAPPAGPVPRLPCSIGPALARRQPAQAAGLRGSSAIGGAPAPREMGRQPEAPSTNPVKGAPGRRSRPGWPILAMAIGAKGWEPALSARVGVRPVLAAEASVRLGPAPALAGAPAAPAGRSDPASPSARQSCPPRSGTRRKRRSRTTCHSAAP